jgi:hypothetical protein
LPNVSGGIARERNPALKLEGLDDVAVYKALCSALERGSRGLRVGTFAYYWGRLSTFTRPSSAGAEQEIGFAMNLVARPNPAEAEAAAEASEADALAVEDQPGKLAMVGYWSVRSYAFRYLGTNDWIWSRHATDSFLSALDDLAASRGGDFLRNETVNLSRAYEAAEALDEAALASGMMTMFRWASSAPLGSELAPHPSSGAIS